MPVAQRATSRILGRPASLGYIRNFDRGFFWGHAAGRLMVTGRSWVNEMIAIAIHGQRTSSRLGYHVDGAGNLFQAARCMCIGTLVCPRVRQA